MKIGVSVIVFIVIGLVYFLWNPNARRIRKIQFLINKDRTVCDVINSLNGWKISNINAEALVIVVNPVVMPMYKLFITYKNHRPSYNEIKALYWELTNENSIVTKAHKLNKPVEKYMQETYLHG